MPVLAQPATVGQDTTDSGEFRREIIEAFRTRAPVETGREKTRLGHELAALNREFRAHVQRSRAPGLRQVFRSANPQLKIFDGYVIVDVVAEQDTEALRTELENLGMQNSAVFGRYVSGRLPLDQLETVNELTSIRLVRASMSTVMSGLVTSQGDIAQHSDDARSVFAVDGAGVMVGSLSDSFDCLGDAATDVANSDLPAGIVVLADEIGCSSGSDEGRAMMQIVHDVAPGADQSFHSAFNGMADFASGIIKLNTVAGAEVINDDVFYFAEPWFQDGVIAQAVDTVKAQGVAYFSSAGNQGDEAYSTAFTDSGQSGFRIGSTAHDFDPGPGTDTRQSLTIPGNTEVIFVLQWDQPFFSVSGAPGATSDLDMILYPSGGGPALAGSIDNNIGGDALEIFSYTNSSSSSQTVRLGIDLVAGPAPAVMMYQYFGSLTVNEYATNSPTVTGHSNAAGGLAVGAVRYLNTPAYGVSPPLRESFSSLGGVPILFDPAGAPIMELRQKPEIMAPNGGDTTFFGIDLEGNGFPNFFGTSAAAPHAAGVAALMKAFDPGAAPDRIYAALQATAVDMDTPGVDFGSGYGLIDAEQAVSALTPLTLTALWAPPPATQGSFYWWEGLQVSGGLPPYSWTISGGFLPFPLSLNENGVVFGTPLTPLTTNFTVQVSDALSATTELSVQLSISPSAYVCGACHGAAGH